MATRASDQPEVTLPTAGLRMDGQSAFAGMPAPTRRSRLPRDGVGQSRAHPGLAHGARVPRRSPRGACCVTQPSLRRRQSEPGLAHVVACADGREQRRCPHVVMAETGSRQRQRQRLVARREPARPIEPASRAIVVPSGYLRLRPLESLDRQRGIFWQWTPAVLLRRFVSG